MPYMQEKDCRTAMVIGWDGVEKLHRSAVAIFGLGGVGSYAAEALARAGIGRLLLVDDDRVAPSNLNRQLYALGSTLGLPKADAAQARIRDIDPEIRVEARMCRYSQETADGFLLEEWDYVIDAIDSVTDKLLLIQKAKEAGTPILSCMGTGNKLDPMGFRVTDMEKTQGCPLARVMRRELKKRGIRGVRAVWSPEPPRKTAFQPEEEAPGRRAIPGSISFVPAAAGLLCAREAVCYLLGRGVEEEPAG